MKKLIYIISLTLMLGCFSITLAADKSNYDQEIAEQTSIINNNPTDVEAYFKRGETYYNFKTEYDLAIADFTRVIELDPTYTLAYVRLSGIYSHRHQHD